jgi:hypothetical protein
LAVLNTHTTDNKREERKKKETTREKRGRRRRGKSVHIWWLRTYRSQAVDWRIKRAWIGTKLGELDLHLEYFDLVSWFGCWFSEASDLRGVLSVRVAAVQNGAVVVDEGFGVANGVGLS